MFKVKLEEMIVIVDDRCSNKILLLLMINKLLPFRSDRKISFQEPTRVVVYDSIIQ